MRIVAPAGILGLLFLCDDTVQDWVLAHPSKHLGDLLNQIVVFGSAGAPLIMGAGLWSFGVFLGRPRLKRLAYLIVASTAIAGAVVLLAKPLIGAQDAPFHQAHDAGERLMDRSWGRFPSGHTAIAFSIAGALVAESSPLTPVGLVVATAVGIERIESNAHVISSVFAGAWLGLFLSSWLARRSKWRLAPGSGAEDGTANRAPNAAQVIAGVLAVALPVVFFFIGSWGFFDPDEGRFIEIPFEMIARGDFITPTLNYVPYFEKPPLFYWLVAGCYGLFGYAEWAARLVPALSVTASLWIAYLLGRRLSGVRAGLFSALILATTPMWVAMGHLVIIDVLLSLLIFLALTLWWFAHTRQDGRTTGLDAAFWIVVGLAVLTKGPVAVVLILGSIALYGLLGRQWRALLRPSWLFTSPLAVLVAAPWFVLVAERNPAFNHFFWYGQHIGRFLGLPGNREHDQGWFYFFWMLPLMLFPWISFVPGAFVSGWRRLLSARTERQRGILYLACSAALITLFFTLSVSKLAQYVLPVLPLVAVLLGVWFDREAGIGSPRWVRPLWRSPMRGGTALTAAFLGLAGAGSFVLGPRLLRDFEGMGPERAIVTGLVLVVWGAMLLGAQRRRDVAHLVGAVAGGTIVLIVWLSLLTMDLAPNHNCKSLLTFVKPGLDAGGTLVTSAYLPTVGFYSRTRLVMSGGAGESTFGMEQIPEAERRAWFPTGIEDLRARLSSPAPMYLLVRDHEEAQWLLPRLGEGVREIIWNQRRSILGNATAALLTPPKPGGVMAHVKTAGLLDPAQSSARLHRRRGTSGSRERLGPATHSGT